MLEAVRMDPFYRMPAYCLWSAHATMLATGWKTIDALKGAERSSRSSMTDFDDHVLRAAQPGLFVPAPLDLQPAALGASGRSGRLAGGRVQSVRADRRQRRLVRLDDRDLGAVRA